MYSNRFNKNIETDDFYRFSRLSKEKEKWNEAVVQPELVENPGCVFKKTGENLK